MKRDEVRTVGEQSVCSHRTLTPDFQWAVWETSGSNRRHQTGCELFLCVSCSLMMPSRAVGNLTTTKGCAQKQVNRVANQHVAVWILGHVSMRYTGVHFRWWNVRIYFFKKWNKTEINTNTHSRLRKMSWKRRQWIINTLYYFSLLYNYKVQVLLWFMFFSANMKLWKKYCEKFLNVFSL